MRGSTGGSMAGLAYVNLGVSRTAKQLAVGPQTTCAILDNDELKCWGYNGYGQLGYDDTTSRGNTGGSMAGLGYVNLGAGRTAKQVSLSYVHSCAVLDNDQIKCWGRNNYGQLGYDDTTTRGNTGGSMAALGYVDLGVGRTAKFVSAGDSFTCAILDNDQVKCWGINSSGQLGYDDTTTRGNTGGSMAALGYVNLGVGRTAKKISLGYSYACAVLDNDQVKCWGANSSGQLGYDDLNNRGLGVSITLDTKNNYVP
jgi:alpha-tubulin suppressor-like RCC1 family protein